jgi:hypothetical protein
LNFTLKYDDNANQANRKSDLDYLVSQINLLTDADKRYSLFINSVEPDIEIFKHHDNDEMIKLMKASKEKCPSITSIYTIGKSEAGTSIYSMIFSDNPLFHDEGRKIIFHIYYLIFLKKLKYQSYSIGEPEIKFMGNMHGDEVVGRELLLQLIVYLCDNYGKSQLITNLIESVRLHIVPTMNPVITY